MSAALHGMAWDHPRARAPLEAVSGEWSRRTGIPVHWDARPLKDFEDQALEELASRYDLLLIDYPFVETAATSGLIVAVEDWADPAYLRDQAAHSVGPSHASYTWAGRQWALAIDAACQVSAVRSDLWPTAGLADLPRDWTDVARLAAQRRTRVAMPLNANHAYCAFLSIGVSLAGPGFWRAGRRIGHAEAVEALEFLRALAADLHAVSRHADPIAVSDLMADTDEVLYVPLMFGYSSYGRPGFRRRTLRFSNAPRGRSGVPGSVLGGVGLALSARSALLEPAADLARTMASPSVQGGLYTRSGGQPGHDAAWASPELDALVGGFFTGTRETMTHAFMRPRVSGHRRFQPLAGVLIHDYVWTGAMSARECVARFDALIETWLPEWHEAVAPVPERQGA